MIEGLKTKVKNLLGKLASINYDYEKSVFVSGSGRSGTTWVSEVISKQINYTRINEPFNVGPELEYRPAEFGFEKVNYRPGGLSEKQKKYVKRVSLGREMHFPWRKLSIRRLVESDGYLIKAVLVNMCFAEILELTGSPGIFLIRHPCGVVSSQRNHPGWAHFSKESRSLPAELIRDYPRFGATYDSISGQLEVLAFWWAVENIVPLRRQHPHPWELVSYESLVREPVKEFSRLIEHVDGEALSLKQLKRDVQKPSSSTKEYSQPGQNPDCVWKERLSPEEIDTICRVVEKCGFEKWELFE